MSKLFNSNSRRKYYLKEFLLMTIYKIAKITLIKMSNTINCITKKIYLTDNGAKGGGKIIEPCQPSNPF